MSSFILFAYVHCQTGRDSVALSYQALGYNLAYNKMVFIFSFIVLHELPPYLQNSTIFPSLYHGGMIPGFTHSEVFRCRVLDDGRAHDEERLNDLRVTVLRKRREVHSLSRSLIG